MLWHLVKTTTKCKMVEDIQDCYDIQLEPLPSIDNIWDYYSTWLVSLPSVK